MSRILAGNLRAPFGGETGARAYRPSRWQEEPRCGGKEKRGADAPPSAKRYILPLAASVLTQEAHILPSFSVALNQTIAPSLGASPSTLVLSFQ